VPAIHSFTTEGFVRPTRKRLIEKVANAEVKAERLRAADRRSILLHEVVESGSDCDGEAITRRDLERFLPARPVTVENESCQPTPRLRQPSIKWCIRWA
jgi:adenine-specific DNA methylase